MGVEFVQTQLTLLQRIASEKTGSDEAEWGRFFELYYPAMLAFARGIGGLERAEDVVQDVLVKLVDVLRGGKYERREGSSFRGYVKTLIRNKMSDLYRREKARGIDRSVELTDRISDEIADASADAGSLIDVEWARACHAAALEHIFTKTALSGQSKEVYVEYVMKKRPLSDVAREFGLTKNYVSQIKTRVDRAVAAIVSEYGA